MTARATESKQRTGLSMRLRLTLWTVSIFIVIQLALASLLLLQQWRSISETQDQALEAAALALRDRVVAAAPNWTLEHLQTKTTNYVFLGVIDAAVLSNDGRLLASSDSQASFGAPNSMQSILDFSGPEAFRMTRIHVPLEDGRSGATYRARIEPFQGADAKPYRMMVYADQATMSRFFDVVTRIVLIIGPIGVVAAAIGAWILAGVAVRPLTELRRAAQHITPLTLDEHINLQSSSSEVTSLERELDQAMQRLETGFDAQSRFISNVSHELRTPISILLTEAENLQRDEELRPDVTEFIESVISEMKQLGRLVESLYLLSRVRDRALEPSETLSNMNDVLLEAIDSCRHFASDHNVQLNPTLADHDEDPLARGDAELLRIMVANPIRNAIRFSEPGENVDIRGERHADRLHVIIRDRGPGMPETLIPTSLDSYVRGGQDRRSGQGMGLGLAITRSIATLHDGSVQISNHPDGGCEVVIELPAAR